MLILFCSLAVFDPRASLALTVSNSSFFTPALLRTHSFVFFAVHETRRIFLSLSSHRRQDVDYFNVIFELFRVTFNVLLALQISEVNRPFSFVYNFTINTYINRKVIGQFVSDLAGILLCIFHISCVLENPWIFSFSLIFKALKVLKHCRQCSREIKQDFISVLFRVVRAAYFTVLYPLPLFETSSCLHYCSVFPSPPQDNIRVMVIVWRLRGNITRTALCRIVWHNVHSQQHTYMSSSYRSNRLG